MNRDSRTNSLEPLTAVPCRGKWKQLLTNYHAQPIHTNSASMEGNYNQQKDMVKIGKNSVDINHTCIFTLVYIDTNTWKRILHTAVTAVKTPFQESPGLAFHAHKGTDSSSLKRVVTGNPHKGFTKGPS